MISDIPGIIGCGILAMLCLWIGKRNGFFAPLQKNVGEDLETDWIFPIRWYHVATVFAAYFASTSIAIPFLVSFLKSASPSMPSIGMATWINFLTSLLVACAIALYALSIPRIITLQLWRSHRKSAYAQDFKFAAFAWTISFPIVIFFNQLFDFILYALFNIPSLPDQLAVRFLKMTLNDPWYFSLTITTIVVLAPLIEETLFRGFLQSFIRKHLGAKSAIFITSLCFSFFHYAPEQGIANISIIGSLFILSLFLGFVYNHQKSLAASMALHAYFNIVNVVGLYFLGTSFSN